MFKNKTLLIPGGTGSFGNAVLRRFLDSDVKEIRIFSRDEKKQDDMRHELQNPKVKFYIGDIRDRQAVDGVMTGVDYIFSAAALKQVPSCEFFPLEAVQTNVLGTNNVLESAVAHGVKNIVVLSTDKAAYPINAMGISKAMMEKVAIAKGRSLGQDAATTICCTRYGNVMGSRGSVIPLWIDQIKAGKPITITNPEMTRFMMTLDDAVNLVIYAWQHGTNGDLVPRRRENSCTAGASPHRLCSLFPRGRGRVHLSPSSAADSCGRRLTQRTFPRSPGRPYGEGPPGRPVHPARNAPPRPSGSRKCRFRRSGNHILPR